MRNIIILGTIIILLVIAILFIVNFNLFDNDSPIEIIQFDSGTPKFKIAVSYVPSNTTIQEQIIIEKAYVNGSRKLLSVFERYQILTSHQIIGDTLVVVLADTSSYVNRLDTLKIAIPK